MAKNDGSGHYYRGDQRIDITWGDKISAGVKKAYEKNKTSANCTYCGEPFLAARPERAKFCSQRCSRKEREKDPIYKKASSLSASLLLGAGKTDWVMEQINNHLHKPCRYCKEILTIESVSIDHIEAYGDSKLRRKKIETKAFRKHMDRKENLQIICRRCNSAKGDFCHVEYQALLDLDSEYPGIRDKLHRRLRMGALAWSRQRKLGA